VEALVQKLKQHHYRITPQRLAIIRILATSRDHPSVEQIFERLKAQFPTTSLATVYKTIGMLKDVGEILELEFQNGGNRYDGNQPKPHPHLICLECHSIVDPEVELDGLPQQVAQRTGYQLVNHRFDIYGICPACQAKLGQA
jgi:Fur family peroxide stress response transcriptional regulator